MTRLRVSNLRKEFASDAEELTVLDGIDLTLEAGEDMAIIGASGSGKSTLLYILGTLDRPTSGSVAIEGIDPFTLPPNELAKFRNRHIGFVFQDHHLLPQLNVTENVLLPALAAGTPSQELMNRAAYLIDAVGLTARKEHLPGKLSGGERQRTAIARALLLSPKLLLADEPTGNLDAVNAAKSAELLFELPKKEGAALVVVTHSDEVAARASRCSKIENKRLQVVRQSVIA
ncbi:MAG: ABC transporter ATP-binding protein [Pirellulales bacterium]